MYYRKQSGMRGIKKSSKMDHIIILYNKMARDHAVISPLSLVLFSVCTSYRGKRKTRNHFFQESEALEEHFHHSPMCCIEKPNKKVNIRNGYVVEELAIPYNQLDRC
jgi:hypothetical protein